VGLASELNFPKDKNMEIILLISAIIVAYLCLRMLGNCLHSMKNVKRGKK